jgi:hypothetical protein
MTAYVLPTPVDAVLLGDLSGKDIEDIFGAASYADWIEGNQPIVKSTQTHRVVALMPVYTVTARKSTRCIGVPFLVDTGSPSTFFEPTKAVELGYDVVDYVVVLEQRVNYVASSGHYSDINMLGSNVLQNTRLIVDYPNKTGSIERLMSLTMTTSYWVKYATAVFKVLPATNDIDSLKDAVKAKAQLLHPSFQLTVKDEKGNVLKASAPLAANTEETAYVVE